MGVKKGLFSTPFRSDEASDVVHLDDESFKPFLKKKKHVLVMFYAPWYQPTLLLYLQLSH